MKTTGIGSLPFMSIHEAVEWSLKHDLSFLPELPKLSDQELMLSFFEQINQGCFLKRLAQDQFRQRLIKESKKELKLQVPGPLTCSFYLKQSTNYSHFKNYLTSFIEEFQSFKTIYLQVDEPQTLENTDEEWKAYQDFWINFSLEFSHVQIGVHSCHAEIDPRLLEIPWRFYSLRQEQFLMDKSFFSDKIIFWPLIKGMDQSLLERASNEFISSSGLYISPDCGLGANSPQEALDIMKKLHDQGQFESY